jgi:hypothetical protein
MDYSPECVRHPVRMHAITYLTLAGQLAIPALAGRDSDPEQFIESVRRDIHLARSLTENPLPDHLTVSGTSPSCAVAAMVLTTDLGDLATDADRDWAITSLVAAAGTLQPFEYRDTTDDQAASRAAARALPAAYASGQDRRDRDILPALHTLATHPVLEVRRILAVNLRTTWAAPCRTTITGRCHHHDVVEVLTSLVRDAVIPISPDAPQLTIDTIEALAMHPGAVLDSGVLGPALATAIDALTF